MAAGNMYNMLNSIAHVGMVKVSVLLSVLHALTCQLLTANL